MLGLFEELIVSLRYFDNCRIHTYLTINNQVRGSAIHSQMTRLDFFP